MPSLLHEALLLLFRNRPQLAAVLLQEGLHFDLPGYTDARLESIDLTQVVPTEYRADLIVLLLHDVPVLAIIVEVQLAADERKRFTWPIYATTTRAQFECDTVVLVVTPTASVARWASASCALGGGNQWSAWVAGPEQIPVVTDPARAQLDPELGVLSVMAHGQGEPARALSIAQAALSGLARLDDEERRVLYWDLIETSLGQAARKAFQMLPQSYRFQSEAFVKGRSEGRLEGHAEGRVEGERAVLQKLLLLKFGALSDDARSKLATASEEDLDRWAARVLTATSAADIFT